MADLPEAPASLDDIELRQTELLLRLDELNNQIERTLHEQLRLRAGSKEIPGS